MVKNFFRGGRSVLYSKQANILSAASIVMIAVLSSRVLGLFRNRTFVHFFPPETLDSFLAAFQLPDLILEVLVLGAMSSAFIPVFSSYLGREKTKEAWFLAGVILNILLLFFLAFSALVFIFAHPIYSLVAQGFSPEQVDQTVFFARILLLAQMFFAASYLLTAVLESNQRFLAPAVAPLFYNLSIILSTILLAPSLGLLAPVLGAVLGSFIHFLVQLPLALELGFRPVFLVNFRDSGVRNIAKLAFPRVVELSFFQVKKLADLFMASLAAGGLTYFRFAESLAALPIGLFGLSIAKASLPQLSKQAANADMAGFKQTFSASLKEILFLALPASVFLAVLRVPAVRLAFGAAQFDWQDTVQTGYALSAFCVGAFAYALSLLVSRAFWALQDTVTPVRISVLTTFINISIGLFLVLGLKLPVWGLSLAYAVAGIVQLFVLLHLLGRKVGGFSGYNLGTAFAKIGFSSGVSGLTMFILLKILDRSVWDKNLSFLGKLGLALPTTFDRFVLDTRYVANLIYLTSFVALVGLIIYIALVYLLKVEELGILAKSIRRFSGKIPYFAKKEETLISPPNGTP
ncbi:MAG: murein biosynthesis integral membrane protein MurJ [Candidatus Blackburnbacteria bacterium]|nr:murein biosynthesis integral membrane protein MurJ [Candidatus Blackburnbacteria bacterium]